MARLNDPPVPPIESIDALKRRFIRQNREIARVNSTQSQRIRNLETEISRLLAENIALRESAIAAAAQAEKSRAATRLCRDVVELKSRLELKLTEVNTLVEELGGLPQKIARRSSYNASRRKSGLVQDPVVSPNEKDWRIRQTLGSAPVDGQDGRLPAIMEDKYYPRRTFENEELRVLTAIANAEKDDTESPDLGPPPIAHFEVADPIVFDREKSPKRVSGGIVTGDEDMMLLSKNLESRRKRRTSSLLQDLSSLHNEAEEEETNQDKDDEHASRLQTQPKRKFDASEMDIDVSQLSQNDGFEYARREANGRNRPKPSRFMSRPADRVQQHQSTQQTLSPQKVSLHRTALAPKSTNSPTKKATVTVQDKVIIPKDTGLSPVRQRASRSTASNVAQMPRIDPPEYNDEKKDTAYAPKTPAPSLEDVISPTSSGMDTIPKTKSTEAAISNSVEDVLNGSIGRGSRRVRAAVSYAEPNLRDKMRRPDKKLVGAVEGISKGGNSSDKEAGREVSRYESNDPEPSAQSNNKILNIKPETNEDERWKILPTANDENNESASPLQNKEKHTTFKPIELRKKRTFSESEGTKSKQVTHARDDLDKAVSRLSIYDPPTSSPISTGTDASSTTIARTSSAITQHPTTTVPTRSRRQSTQIASASHIPTSSNPPSSSALSSRPHSSLSSRSAATLGKENINHSSTSSAASKLKRASSVQSMSINTSQPALQGPNQDQGRGPTTEVLQKTLVGSRRRSMMV